MIDVNKEDAIRRGAMLAGSKSKLIGLVTVHFLAALSTMLLGPTPYVEPIIFIMMFLMPSYVLWVLHILVRSD